VPQFQPSLQTRAKTRLILFCKEHYFIRVRTTDASPDCHTFVQCPALQERATFRFQKICRCKFSQTRKLSSFVQDSLFSLILDNEVEILDLGPQATTDPGWQMPISETVVRQYIRAVLNCHLCHRDHLQINALLLMEPSFQSSLPIISPSRSTNIRFPWSSKVPVWPTTVSIHEVA